MCDSDMKSNPKKSFESGENGPNMGPIKASECCSCLYMTVGQVPGRVQDEGCPFLFVKIGC